MRLLLTPRGPATGPSPTVRTGLLGLGTAALALGMLGGGWFEGLGLWAHVVQHLLLGVAGPALLVTGVRSRSLGQVRRRPRVLAALGWALAQPLLLVLAGSEVLEAHALLHTVFHLAVVVAGVAVVQTVLAGPVLRASAGRTQAAVRA